MNDVFDTRDPRDREVERRLEAYADLRLSPGVAATTRMRTVVMAAAHRRSALLQAAATTAPMDATLGAAGAALPSGKAVSGPAARRSRPTRHPWRLAIAAVVAATLTLGIVAGTVVGSGAGGPLYGTRLWVEFVNLPTDVVARAQAEVARLEARLQEARQASAAADSPATEAALEAYSTIVAEATVGAGGDAAATVALEDGVGRHVEVLTALAGQVPASARAAIQHALASSTKALDGLEHPGSSDPGDVDHQGGPGTQGQPGGPSDQVPDKTPKPQPTEPDKTPRPTHTNGTDQGEPKGTPDHPDPSRKP